MTGRGREMATARPRLRRRARRLRVPRRTGVLRLWRRAHRLTGPSRRRQIRRVSRPAFPPSARAGDLPYLAGDPRAVIVAIRREDDGG